MILHRFMSRKEFDAYMRGETLTNKTNHETAGRASTAVGFCWFDDDPDEAVHRLSGNVDLDICLTVETNGIELRKCFGRYPNWVRPGIREGSCLKTEYCCRRYSKERLAYVSHADRFSTYAPNASLLRELFPFLYQ